MSTMTSQQRQAIRLQNEGAVLMTAGNIGVEHAIEHVCSTVDGEVNGLLKICDHERLAIWLCALADRATLGIRGATLIPEAFKKKMPAPPEGGALGFLLEK